jgi:hypothetical protein
MKLRQESHEEWKDGHENSIRSGPGSIHLPGVPGYLRTVVRRSNLQAEMPELPWTDRAGRFWSSAGLQSEADHRSCGEKLTEAEMIELVQDGKGKMQPFKDELTGSQIKASTDYLRTFLK